MHKRAFRALKHKFMNVPHLPPPYFVGKKKFKKQMVFLSKYVGGRPETCITVRFGSLKPTFMHVSGLPSACFDLKTTYLRNCFFNHSMVVEDLGHA